MTKIQFDRLYILAEDCRQRVPASLHAPVTLSFDWLELVVKQNFGRNACPANVHARTIANEERACVSVVFCKETMVLTSFGRSSATGTPSVVVNFPG